MTPKDTIEKQVKCNILLTFIQSRSVVSFWHRIHLSSIVTAGVSYESRVETFLISNF